MSNFSDWTEVTYVNNDAPHITASNLNKNETALTKVMGELNSYNTSNMKDFIDYAINNNTKEIHNFENTSDFTTTGYMSLGQARASAVTFGSGGVTMQSTRSSSASIGIYDTFSSIDLTTFNFGASSSSSDYIFFAFFVSDSSKIRNILIRLGDDDSNCYYKFIPSWTSTWNFKKFQKSEFGTDGTPSGWDDITFLRIYVETYTNSQSDYVICNKMWLSRKDANSSASSCLYVTDGSGNYDSAMYLQSYDDIVAYYDKYIGKKGFHSAMTSYSSDMLQVMSNVNSFSFKCEMYAKVDEYAGSLRWYINAYNFIEVECHLNKLLITQCNNGDYSYIAQGTLTDYIYNNDRMELWVEKTPDNIIRARLEVDGMKPVYAESPTDLSSTASGDLGIVSSFWGANYFVTDFVANDFVANNNPSIPLPSFSSPLKKIVTKLHDDSVQYDITPTADNELFIKLPSNSFFEVDFVAIYSCASALPDIQFTWTVTGDYEVFHDGRIVMSTGAAATSFTDVELNLNNYVFSTEASAGTVSGGEMPYFEKIMIKTGDSGCKMQLNWSQNTSRVESVTLEAGSFIRAIKL
jgi:hypothetical protein